MDSGTWLLVALAVGLIWLGVSAMKPNRADVVIERPGVGCFGWLAPILIGLVVVGCTAWLVARVSATLAAPASVGTVIAVLLLARAWRR